MKVLLIVIALLFLTGCAAAVDTGKTAAQAKLADALIQAGVVEAAIFSVELTDAELDVYMHALETYQRFREAWSQPTVEMYLLIDAQYAELVTAYRSVEAVVAAHWLEYPPAVQRQLQQYQAQARAINEGVGAALAAKAQQATLNNALELGLLIAKIIAV